MELLSLLPKNLKDLYELGLSGEKIIPELPKCPGNLEETWLFLSTPDTLTDALYVKNSPSKYTFRSESEKIIFATYIGDLYSPEHKENIKEHACIMTSSLIDLDVAQRTAAVFGVFHDLGKKYTYRLNNEGYFEFPGHEIISAYLAVLWGKNLLFLGERKKIFAAIYAHERAKEWNKNQGDKNEFTKELEGFLEEDPKECLKLIEKAVLCNTGCKETNFRRDPSIDYHLSKGGSVIRWF